MRRERRSRTGRNGNRHRRRKSHIRGILMFAALVIVVGIYVAVGNRLFSEKASDDGRNIAKEIQSTEETLEDTGEIIEVSPGDPKQLRTQLAEIKNMNLEDYTEETVKNLFDYIAAAQTLIAGNASQEKMDEMSNKLNEAVEDLVLTDNQI